MKIVGMKAKEKERNVSILSFYFLQGSIHAFKPKKNAFMRLDSSNFIWIFSTGEGTFADTTFEDQTYNNGFFKKFEIWSTNVLSSKVRPQMTARLSTCFSSNKQKRHNQLNSKSKSNKPNGSSGGASAEASDKVHILTRDYALIGNGRHGSNSQR